MAVHDANPATLSAALKAAKPGDGIILEAGDYRGLRLADLDGVTIVSNDSGAPARFIGGLIVSKCTGVTFHEVAFESGEITVASSSVVTVSGGSAIAFRSCRFAGHETADGDRLGRGLVVSGVAGLSVKDSRFQGLYRGAVIASTTDLEFERNDLYDLGSDGLNLGQVRGATVIGNQFVGFRPGSGDHPDGIQVMTTAAGGPSEDVMLYGNLVVCGETARAQGVFVRAENPAVRHRNIRVVDNVLCNAGLNAISVGSTDEVLITGNTCLFTPLPPKAKQSNIRAENTNGRVEGNKAMGFIPGSWGEQGGNQIIAAASAEQIAEEIAAWEETWRPAAVEPKPEPEPEVIEITLKPGQRLIVTGAA